MPTGSANVWTWMTCDEELGLVYAPTSTPNNDWYGGHRPGDGLFGESIVALDARTGERRWHFQAVRHGLWDYDFPAAPILAELEVEGREIPALVQVSKQAFVYVLDRRTGDPVWPVVDVAVPQSTVPGERTAATQPIPSWPLPFDLQGIKFEDLIDYTPELRSRAAEWLQRFRPGRLYQPPSLPDDVSEGILQLLGRPVARTGTVPHSIPRPTSSTSLRSRSLPRFAWSSRTRRAATSAT